MMKKINIVFLFLLVSCISADIQEDSFDFQIEEINFDSLTNFSDEKISSLLHSYPKKKVDNILVKKNNFIFMKISFRFYNNEVKTLGNQFTSYEVLGLYFDLASNGNSKSFKEDRDTLLFTHSIFPGEHMAHAPSFSFILEQEQYEILCEMLLNSNYKVIYESNSLIRDNDNYTVRSSERRIKKGKLKDKYNLSELNKRIKFQNN